MKMFSSAALSAIIAGEAVVSGAVAILAPTDPAFVWGGYGTLALDGYSFDGVGDRAMAQVSNGALGSAAQNVTLALNGLEPEVLELVDAGEYRSAPVIIWRLIFDGGGTTLLDAHVYTRGRLDLLTRDEVIGGSAMIEAAVEGAARGLRRKGGRMRTDADQRLVKPTDGGFKAVSYAAEKTLYWAGKIPATAGVALGGTSAGSKAAAAFAARNLPL